MVRPKPSGFTLVELLTVIAIIALLLAILVPMFGRAKEAAYDAQCRSNLHQIHGMLHMGTRPTLPGASAWVGAVRGRGGSLLLQCPKDGGKRAPVSAEAELAGDVQWIEPPPNCRFNVIESNTVVHAFVEQECYTLPASVNVNISQPGLYTSDASLTPAVLPAGTVVDSLFMFFDPVGSQNATASGKVTMPGEIIGVICKTADLDASDATVGRPGTIYATGQDNARGFELGAEKVELSSDRRTFILHQFQSTFPGENVRILTVPGGIASYGMNKMVKSMPRAGQVMMLDYDRTVADYDGSVPDDVPSTMIQLRHYKNAADPLSGKANILLIDGSVQSRAYDEIDPGGDEWKP